MASIAVQPRSVNYDTEEQLPEYAQRDNNQKRRNTRTSRETATSGAKNNRSASGDEQGLSRAPTLTRGLQVPSRSGCISSGFKFPHVLEKSGVGWNEWYAFTAEVEELARLSPGQWATTIGGGVATGFVGGVFISFFAVIPASFVVHKLRKDREVRNLTLADQNGALSQCVGRWNTWYFNSKRLAVRVDIPGRVHDMGDMDVSSSKLFKNQQRTGILPSQLSSTDERFARTREGRKSQAKEGHSRVKASLRGRIVIIPLDHNGLPIQSESTLRDRLPQRTDGANDDELDTTIREDEDDQVSMFGSLLRQRDHHPQESKA